MFSRFAHQKRCRALGIWNRNFTTAPLEFRRAPCHPRQRSHRLAALASRCRLRRGVLARQEVAWTPRRHPPILLRFPPPASANRHRTVSALSPSSPPAIPTPDFRIYHWPPQPPHEVTQSPVSLKLCGYLCKFARYCMVYSFINYYVRLRLP